MGSKRKRYSPDFKFRVVMEALRTDKPMAEVARAYDVHPVTLSQWKRHFEEHGAEVFGGQEDQLRLTVTTCGTESAYPQLNLTAAGPANLNQD